MALPKVQEARALNDEDLAQAIVDTKKKLFELRLNKATGREFKSHEFKHNRHRLAQLMTVERERQIAAAKNKEIAPNETKVEEKQKPQPEE